MPVDTSVDRDAIRDLLARYTYHGDRGRVSDLAACFAPNGILEYLGKAPMGPQAIAAALSAGGTRDPRLSFIRHHISNPLITLDGDWAEARSYFAVHTDIGPDHSGTYDDRLARTAQGWRFSHRRVRIDWQSDQSLFVAMPVRQARSNQS